MNLKTRIRSSAARYFSSEKYQVRRQAKARAQRQRKGESPVVHYFHQVDDPYSHLAVQKLDQLKATYNIAFKTHLVAKPEPVFQGSHAHFDEWAYRDAISVAADYKTHFAPSNPKPEPAKVSLANTALVPHLDQADFAEAAFGVGEALWGDQGINTSGSPQSGEQAVTAGNALRAALGHYQGAMFYFDGEWYWGIDRIRLLEQRLINEKFGGDSTSLCVPQPTPKTLDGKSAKHILLEYFPSLRSPYTAIGHQRVLDLIDRTGVTVSVRPVMPMMMRGVPAPREKQRYIITDAAREARAHGVRFGHIVDPFGEPVRRAFALFPGAKVMGKDMEFVTAYLAAAWQDGVDITKESGLKAVTAKANINWDALQQATNNTDWEAMLTDNLNEMLGASLWGVPSFRVSGGNSSAAYACWGQDRIWRVENDIVTRTEH